MRLHPRRRHSVLILSAVVLFGALGASSAQAATPPITNPVVTAFNPYLNSADGEFNSQGFDFVNLFKNSKFTKRVDGHNFVFAGSYGLCGGMAYAALDTFNAGNGTTTPSLGTPSGQPGVAATPQSGPVFNYLYSRLIDSLSNGTIPTMLEYMVAPQVTRNGITGDDEMTFNAFRHQIVPSINAGNPIPLLIVEARDLPDVSDNHQVLAIGYFRRGGPNGQAVVEIYDPNFPGRIMYLNTSENNGFPSRVETEDAAGQDVVAHFYGFFSNNRNYSYHKPPWALAQPTGNLLQTPGADWTQADWNGTGGSETLDPPLGAPDATHVVFPADWTTTGQFSAVQYGATRQVFGLTLHASAHPVTPVITVPTIPFPTTAFGTSISGGENFFAGGPGKGTSQATQTIVLRNSAALIDAGHQLATLSGYLGGELTDSASMVVMASFINGSGATLSGFSIGPVTAADRGDQTELLAQSARARVPVGTATIKVTMRATGQLADYNDAFADNLSLSLATVGVKKPLVR